jgi:Do/DeqQ family serine protease
MKKIFSLVLVSVLGGAITLGSYKFFIEKKESIAQQQSTTSPFTIPVSYKSVNTNLPTGETVDFTTAAEKTIHSVVHVRNTTNNSGGMSFEDLFFGRRSQRSQVGMGSGVIISSDGMIITNNHVIDGAQDITITLNNNKSYEAELIGTDPKTDIALLKIEADEDLPYTTFGDSDTSKVGEWVLAVGNPFNLTSTVTAGIISAKSRDLSGGETQSFIQTDAAVNPGNSGGALVNTLGELIGINTAITSQTGSYVGYSFAVPSNIARKVIEDIMEFGNVQNGVLGIKGGTFNSSAAEEMGVNYTEGVYVAEVVKNSGAEKAGIKTGDIIMKLDNIEISKFEDLSGYIKTKRPDDTVNVELFRDDDLKSVSVTLTKTEMFTVNFMKMELQDLTDSFKDKYNIDYGVMVKKTENEWLYSNLGISEGYIITGINDSKIESITDISKLQEKYGDHILDHIKKLEYINTRKEKKEVLFK